MTLRPLGPSVTLTALLRISTPRSILSRASEENLTSLAVMAETPRMWESVLALSGFGILDGDRAFEHAHHIGLPHDQELLAGDLDFRARPLAEKDAFARLEVERRELAVLV